MTTTKWQIDPGHSGIQFKVKHLAIANVTGAFLAFNGEVITENEDFHNAKVNCTILPDSINTNNPQRDKDLKSDTFFDTPQFPLITFSGTLGNDEMTGELTIRGISQQVTLATEFTGTGKGRFNDLRAGFEATGKINRKDFGLSFNMLTDNGGLLLGEEIKLHLDIELIQQS